MDPLTIAQFSPLPSLRKSLSPAPGPGSLCVVMARAGVGKSAFLVQVGLDALLSGREVLHLAIGLSIEHVQAWYDALLDDLARRTNLPDREDLRVQLGRRRVIHAHAVRELSPEDLDRAVSMYAQHMNFKPAAILVDGFDWSAPTLAISAALAGLKARAQALGAELWMTAQTRREEITGRASALPAPCQAHQSLIDVAVLLEPSGEAVCVQVQKGLDRNVPVPPPLLLHADTLRLVTQGADPVTTRLPASAHVLLSGGADGAEAAFGNCAERYGLAEANFSFKGHKTVRTRGQVLLSDAELRQGDISWAYLTARMHRAYPQTAEFRKVLQSIWHQIHTASEVFVVGVIQADKTVRGGTGWGVELARHWGKPVFVYDQEKKAWFAWQGQDWAEVAAPRISHTRFAGTGTRSLSPQGLRAIEDLFERTFGAKG